MAYRTRRATRTTSRGGYRRSSSRRTTRSARAPARRTTRRAPARRAAPREIRIVIQQPGVTGVPAMPVGENLVNEARKPAKAKL